MPSFKIKGDPLLTAAKVMLVITEIVLVFTMVVIAIVVGVVLTGHRANVMTTLDASGAPGATYAMLILYFLIVVAAIFLGLCLVINLKRIVGTVGEGDPFVPANADRLMRMGWFALGVQLCGFVLGAISSGYGGYVQHLGRDHMRIALDGDHAGLTGLALAIILFILARVFRRGTEMRHELEGTV